jgi:hypothetical protein
MPALPAQISVYQGTGAAHHAMGARWPGQEKRAERLRAALAVARAKPPRVVKGNLLTDLAALMVEAPERATLVDALSDEAPAEGCDAAREAPCRQADERSLDRL